MVPDIPANPAPSSGPDPGQVPDPEYWHGLITEREAAAFLGFTVRCLQNWRSRGGGPRYIKIHGRCIRYRRVDLRGFAEARMRSSTSGASPEIA